MLVYQRVYEQNGLSNLGDWWPNMAQPPANMGFLWHFAGCTTCLPIGLTYMCLSQSLGRLRHTYGGCSSCKNLYPLAVWHLAKQVWDMFFPRQVYRLYPMYIYVPFLWVKSQLYRLILGWFHHLHPMLSMELAIAYRWYRWKYDILQ